MQVSLYTYIIQTYRNLKFNLLITSVANPGGGARGPGPPPLEMLKV